MRFTTSLLLLCLGSASACTAAGAAVCATLGSALTFGSAIKGHEIRQVYYVGAVDPLGQVPPSLYRITFRGEASVISSVRFESGWVKSELVDSLGTTITLDDNGKLEFGAPAADSVSLDSDRRMWLFGPEGFRRAPDDERLVLVMGSDPSAFFAAVSQVLGEVRAANDLTKQSMEALQTKASGLLLDVLDEESLRSAEKEGGS